MGEPDLVKGLTLDQYDRRARLAAGLAAVLPAIGITALWMPDLLTFLAASALVGIVCVSFLMAVARKSGKRIQEEMLAKLGAWPTTIALRHGEPFLAASRDRYHRLLREKLGLDIPDADVQRLNGRAADQLYEAAIDKLRELTREQPKFARLLGENINYGYWRNLRGLKPAAIVILAVCIVLDIVGIGLALRAGSPVQPIAIGLLAVFVIALFLWIFVVTRVSVEAAARNYAQTLLASLDVLFPETRP